MHIQSGFLEDNLNYNKSMEYICRNALLPQVHIDDGGGGCVAAESNVTGAASLHNGMEICRNVYRHSWIQIKRFRASTPE